MSIAIGICISFYIKTSIVSKQLWYVRDYENLKMPMGNINNLQPIWKRQTSGPKLKIKRRQQQTIVNVKKTQKQK